MAKRAYLSLETRLAAALLARGEIPYGHAKLMTARQMCSLYHWDHNKRHAEGGDDHFSNLAPMLIKQHRDKTAKKDIPEIAKNKRIQARQQTFVQQQQAKVTGEAAPRPSRPRWKVKLKKEFVVGDRVRPTKKWRKDSNRIPSGVIVNIEPWGRRQQLIYVKGSLKAFSSHVFELEE